MLGIIQTTKDIKLASQSSAQLQSEKIIAPIGDDSSKELNLEMKSMSMSSDESFKEFEEKKNTK